MSVNSILCAKYRYLSLEYVSMGELMEKSGVFSFGIVLLISAPVGSPCTIHAPLTIRAWWSG
jgi:hypothetical protein